jgi:dihydrolipoamide dehydrogenase
VTDRSLLLAGGGPAGITAAPQARELGAQVTLLETDQVGGTSLGIGDFPQAWSYLGAQD